jgi:hypothetical protein
MDCVVHAFDAFVDSSKLGSHSGSPPEHKVGGICTEPTLRDLANVDTTTILLPRTKA